MAKAKITNVTLRTAEGKTLVVTYEHAEKILRSKNNKGVIKLDDSNFELTENGLRKRTTKKDTKESN
jgi:beta-xylosidase